MVIESKKFEVVEVYIEDKNYEFVNNKAKEYRANGFKVSNPSTHYGENGNEEDKMYWVTAIMKVQIS